jgi:plastocyanin
MRWRLDSLSRTRGRAIVCALSLGLGAAAMTACAPDPYSGHDGLPPSTVAVATPDHPVVHVQARDNALQEQDITVAAGTEVVWTNVGRNPHDIVPTEFEENPAAAPWGVLEANFGPGATYAHVFDEPGVYAYMCTIHGIHGKGMAGTITVTA